MSAPRQGDRERLREMGRLWSVNDADKRNAPPWGHTKTKWSRLSTNQRIGYVLGSVMTIILIVLGFVAMVAVLIGVIRWGFGG